MKWHNSEPQAVQSDEGSIVFLRRTAKYGDEPGIEAMTSRTIDPNRDSQEIELSV